MMPWKKAATSEPAENAKFHSRRLEAATQRNSKATPRNTSASSMMMTGR